MVRGDRLTATGTHILSAAMQRRVVIAALYAGTIAASSFVGACGGDPVGRICDLGGVMPSPGETVVSSPALDCVSRECLYVPLGRSLPMGSMYPDGDNGLCTAECQQDSDCDRVPESPCVTGFTCAIAVTVGPFCCQRFCECKDYIVIPPDGTIPDPLACDPTNSANACCNLAGRRGNSNYPICAG
jgi:hypothetical protein